MVTAPLAPFSVAYMVQGWSGIIKHTGGGHRQEGGKIISWMKNSISMIVI